jgi:hypothetical protein
MTSEPKPLINLIDEAHRMKIPFSGSPVFVTPDVWELCVVWTDADTEQAGVWQTEHCRLMILLEVITAVANAYRTMIGPDVPKYRFRIAIVRKTGGCAIIELEQINNSWVSVVQFPKNDDNSQTTTESDS